MSESTVKSRLLEYLKYHKISQTEFTKKLGVSSTYIGAMRKGIPAEKLKVISSLYPDLNRDWLLYGEGRMLNEPQSGSGGKENIESFETLLLPVEAYAGNLQMWSRGIMERDCQRIVSPVPDADFAIPVRGDSMEPLFRDGSTLLVKKINEKAFIPWGHPMVLDTENGVLVKNVLPFESQNDRERDRYIIAQSQNPNYPPIKIPTASIYGLYRVIGSFNLYPTL